MHRCDIGVANDGADGGGVGVKELGMRVGTAVPVAEEAEAKVELLLQVSGPPEQQQQHAQGCLRRPPGAPRTAAAGCCVVGVGAPRRPFC